MENLTISISIILDQNETLLLRKNYELQAVTAPRHTSAVLGLIGPNP